MDHLTEQDAGLLEQAATMLEERAEEQRTLGNCSAAEGAACSAHAIRRLAPAMLRAGRGCLAQIEEPAAPAAVTPQGEWRIDTSTGRGILVYKNCSVIEAEQAPYVLGLIAADAAAAHAPALEAPAAPAAPKREVTDGTRTLLEDCISAIRDYAGSRPEEGESWESWFEAAFDLCQSRVRRVFDDHALAAAPQAPAAPVGMPAQGDPAALLQLAEVLESGRSLINIERKEAAEALRRQAAAAQAAPAAPSADEREAYVEFLAGKFPQTYSKGDAEHWWDHGHVSALTWKAARTQVAPAAPAVDAKVQWWLARLDQYGNPKLTDGAHSDRGGADQAAYLIAALNLGPGEKYAVARVELTEPRPSADGVNQEAIALHNRAAQAAAQGASES